MPYPTGFRRASPFADRPVRRVFPDGPTPNRVLLIGEKPGREEAQRGRPFIGRSGKWMDVFLEAANVPRNTVRITNLVWEFTEYSKPTAEEIARDHDDLVAEILTCNPKVIGLVGAWAVEHVLLNGKADMERTHGVPIWVPSLFGDELYRDEGWLCLPLMHPANCAHSPDSAPHVLDDFLRLGQLLDGEIHVRKDELEGKENYLEVDAIMLRKLLYRT